jgi:acyl-CoA reductase-like NAD-dependent aldehyde dehydrogenase
MPAQRNPQVKYTQLFINNQYVNSVSGKTFNTINPATGDVIARVQEGDKADVDKAVLSAQHAFKRNSVWRKMDASGRGRLLNKLADLLERDSDYLASLETLNNGMVYHLAHVHVQRAAEYLRYNGGLADKLHGKTIPMDGPYFAFTRLEPIGVVAAILPYNTPLSMFAWKLGQALAAGNTLIIKPAEQTPLTALHLGSLIVEAGFPAGVVNIISGFGQTAGQAIAENMVIRKVSFTGSLEVGRQIQAAAGRSNCKRVTLELGGNSPLVVFDDADLEDAVNTAQKSAFGNQGQMFSASQRIYVHENVYDQFVKKSIELASKRTVGDPFDDNTQQGPQIDDTHFNRILSYIELGQKEGAKLGFGGKRVGNKGYYIQPTVFFDATDNMKIAREQVFGPVQVFLKFRTLDEVIERCNDSNYGLAAGIFTRDIDRAHEFTQAVESGTVWVNNYYAFRAHLPFGGFKLSGNAREGGLDGLMDYLEIKSVAVKLDHKNS